MIVLGPLADIVSVESLLIVSGIVTFFVTAIAVLIPSGRAALKTGAEHPNAVLND